MVLVVALEMGRRCMGDVFNCITGLYPHLYFIAGVTLTRLLLFSYQDITSSIHLHDQFLIGTSALPLATLKPLPAHNTSLTAA